VEQGDFVGGAIDHNNFDIQYWIEHNGKIRKTTNGTSATPTVTQIMNSGGSDYNSSGLWTTPMDLHPTDPNTLIVGKYKVWRTTDGGTTWDSIPGSSSSTAFKSIVYAPSNPNYIYASINFLSIYICTNGNTFVQRNTPWNIVNGFAVSYTNPQKVWAAMGISSGSNGVYYSNDAGLTWTNYSTGLPNYYMNQIVYQNGSNDGLYLASDIGVYYRDASMTSWIPFSNGLPNTQVTDLKIDYLSGKLRASTYGRGIWETNLYTTGINELNKSEESISIYPNPAKDNVTITINNQQSIHKNELSIYNVVGEKVFSETLTSNVEKLNVEKFSAGVYFVKVIDGEKTFTQKLIIQ
jgi:hypothetical protein